jgi:hypothetical protein
MDLRAPIGLLFTLYGLILVGYGAFGPQDIYVKSLGENVNLHWGAAFLVFGLIMLIFGVLRMKYDAAHPDEVK